MDTEELNEKFGIEGEIGFAELDGDLPFVMISNKYAEVDISLYGAHLLSFRPKGTIDVMWMSPLSAFEKGKAIRGGIPVCFPWFGPHVNNASLPQHGFARLMIWEVAEVRTLEKGESQVVLKLASSEETKTYWPHDFVAEMNFVIGPKLTVSLKVTNTSGDPITYSAALHSYFNFSGIENIAIEGLENTHYENQLDGKRYVQEEKLLKISEAITRHYFDTETDCIIHDPYFKRSIQIEKLGSKCSTVWNPGAETCSQMNDMPDDGYETFVCLETVNKINNLIQIEPGESHETTAIISVD